jgi:integrase
VSRFAKDVARLVQFAVSENFRADDPTQGVKLPRIKSDGVHTWTEAEIAQYEERHALGARARLALALLAYTAQRRGDVVGMGRQHIRDGAITVRQQKTGATLLSAPPRPSQYH